MSDESHVYRRHADELVRYATALVGPADAADVVVEAVLSAFRSPGWGAVENQRAYLYRAVLNRAQSVRRGDGRRAAREARAAALEVADRRSSAAGSAGSSIDAQRALAALSAQQRAVIYFTYWDDLTPAQVAAMLGVGEGTVRKQLARAREQLRRTLDEH